MKTLTGNGNGGDCADAACHGLTRPWPWPSQSDFCSCHRIWKCRSYSSGRHNAKDRTTNKQPMPTHLTTDQEHEATVVFDTFTGQLINIQYVLSRDWVDQVLGHQGPPDSNSVLAHLIVSSTWYSSSYWTASSPAGPAPRLEPLIKPQACGRTAAAITVSDQVLSVSQLQLHVCVPAAGLLLASAIVLTYYFFDPGLLSLPSCARPQSSYCRVPTDSRRVAPET